MDLGINIDIPDINDHLQNFLSNTEYVFIDPFYYPATGLENLPNILSSNNEIFQRYGYDITIGNVPNWAKVKVEFIDSTGNSQPFGWLGIDITPEGIFYSGVGWLINDGILESSEIFNDCGCALDNNLIGQGTLKVYVNEHEYLSKPLTIIE